MHPGSKEASHEEKFELFMSFMDPSIDNEQRTGVSHFSSLINKFCAAETKPRRCHPLSKLILDNVMNGNIDPIFENYRLVILHSPQDELNHTWAELALDFHNFRSQNYLLLPRLVIDFAGGHLTRAGTRENASEYVPYFGNPKNSPKSWHRQVYNAYPSYLIAIGLHENYGEWNEIYNGEVSEVDMPWERNPFNLPKEMTPEDWED